MLNSSLPVTNPLPHPQESHFTINSSQEKKDEHLQPLDDSICGSTARDKDSVPQWEKIGRLRESLV